MKRAAFDARATFRKWPSLNGQRRIDSSGPYLLMDGTLDACIREFLAKPPAALPRDTSTRFIRRHSHHWLTQ